MRIGGVLWGRRPPKAGGGPVLGWRPARRAGRRQNLSLIASGISLQSVKACPKCGSEDFVKKGSDTNVKHAVTVRKLGKVKPQRFWWMAFALG